MTPTLIVSAAAMIIGVIAAQGDDADAKPEVVSFGAGMFLTGFVLLIVEMMTNG